MTVEERLKILDILICLLREDAGNKDLLDAETPKAEILLEVQRAMKEYYSDPLLMDNATVAEHIAACLSSQLDDPNNEDEPYFGWCDVDGCENEGSSGGIAWRDTAYWTVCSKHLTEFIEGKPQPKMKQKAIDRENSRDKATGLLRKDE